MTVSGDCDLAARTTASDGDLVIRAAKVTVRAEAAPSKLGRMPRIHWLMATKFQAAVPVSHEFLASPCVGASRPAIIWA